MGVLFYADNGILALTSPDHLQEALDVLTGLFVMVGIQTNVKKMVGMVCQPCYMFVGKSEVAYTRRITGLGTYFREFKQERVHCPECEVDPEVGFMEAHRQAQNGTGRAPQWATTPPPPDPRIYRVSFLRATRSIGRQMEGYEGMVTIHNKL